jgi:hypothetical protein
MPWSHGMGIGTHEPGYHESDGSRFTLRKIRCFPQARVDQGGLTDNPFQEAAIPEKNHFSDWCHFPGNGKSIDCGVDQIVFKCGQAYYVMGNLLYIIAVILIIGWLVGFFAFHVGGIIHILLVIAVIAVILRVIQGKKIV